MEHGVVEICLLNFRPLNQPAYRPILPATSLPSKRRKQPPCTGRKVSLIPTTHYRQVDALAYETPGGSGNCIPRRFRVSVGRGLFTSRYQLTNPLESLQSNLFFSWCCKAKRSLMTVTVSGCADSKWDVVRKYVR